MGGPTTTGVVKAAAAGGMVSVLLAGQSSPQPIAIGRGVTVAVNDTVLVLLGAAPYVIFSLGTAASATVPSTPGAWTPPTGVPRLEAVTPIGSKTWRGSVWRSDVTDLYCGDWTGRGVNWGATWYGTGFRGRGTLAAGSVGLLRRAGGNAAEQTPTMLLLADASQPAAWTAPLATAAGPALSIGVATTWGLPAGWRTQLEAGTAGGIGIGQAGTSPYIVIAPPTVQATFT